MDPDQMRPEQFIDIAAWEAARRSRSDADRCAVVVLDSEMGCIVQVTTADGRVFYGVDGSR